MTPHYPDLGSASDWLNQISHAARPIRSTIQIWVVTRHQYGISAVVSQTSFGGETKCRLFSQTKFPPKQAICEFKLQNSYHVRISFLRKSRRITFMWITYFLHFKERRWGQLENGQFCPCICVIDQGWGQDAWIWAKFLLAFLWTQIRSIKVPKKLG